jgi:hypothetical protein
MFSQDNLPSSGTQLKENNLKVTRKIRAAAHDALQRKRRQSEIRYCMDESPSERQCRFCGERLMIGEADEFDGACGYCAKKWRDVFDPRV